MANEKRFIDANEAQAKISELSQLLLKAGNPEMAGAVARAAEMIGEMSTVDAVKVVRCHKCKWYNADDELCRFWPDEGYRDPEHFCGEGEITDDSSD